MYFYQYTIGVNDALRYGGNKIRAVTDRKKTFAVNFFTEDSVLIEKQLIREGSPARAIEIPDKPGFIKNGWSLSTDSIISYMNVYAVYNEYDLSGTGNIGDYSYVDLELPSGKKWATFNVGSSAPYEIGNYYAWG